MNLVELFFFFMEKEHPVFKKLLQNPRKDGIIMISMGLVYPVAADSISN